LREDHPCKSGRECPNLEALKAPSQRRTYEPRASHPWQQAHADAQARNPDSFIWPG
jgi:hypothetical protein